MGLFSFLKKAGSNVLNRKEKESKGISPDELQKKKVEALEQAVREHNLKIDKLSLALEGDVVTVYGEAPDQAEKEKAILLLGNIEGIACVEDKISVHNPEPAAVYYEVKKGDSLSKIAKAHYGDAMKYMEIFNANKPMLKDPNLIYPGQVLRIPPIDDKS